MSFSLAACSRHDVPPAPDASALLQNIAAPDPEKYPTLQENKHWGNPYLVIRADAIGLLSGAAANEEQMLKPEEVLPALAHLPASAWPYGRVVAILVQEKSTVSEQGKGCAATEPGDCGGRPGRRTRCDSLGRRFLKSETLP